ncbi:MAG: hypothetical protein RL291_792 [Pseudomonadota bacterium]|jgi:hypothetical protein
MTGSEALAALAFVVFVHVAAGAIGFVVMARAAFRDAAAAEGGTVKSGIDHRRAHLPPEVYEPAGWPFLALTPFVVALLAPPAWLRTAAQRDVDPAPRAFLAYRTLGLTFGVLAIALGAAMVEMAPSLS